MTRDHQHNRDPNENAARIVAGTTAAPKSRWLVASGIILVVMGVLMMKCGLAVFVATEDPGPILQAIGGISFFTWWIPVLLGIALLVVDRFS